MNILISALGIKPDIIEETIGLFNYNSTIDFYAGRQFIAPLREEIEPVDELWLIATDREKSSYSNFIADDFETVKRNCGKYGANIKIFVLDAVADITTENEAKSFHDLTLRVVSYAKQKLAGGKLFLSMACGRKTMSTDIQDAAFCFGCDMLLHVLGDNMADAAPILMGPTLANEAIKPEIQEFDDAEYVKCQSETKYLESIELQKAQAQHFYTTYYLNEKETRSNFHILYTLPPTEINRLKSTIIGVDPRKQKEELEWIGRLPKTDLHCHLGGVLNPSEMIEVAKCYQPLIEEELQYNSSYRQWFEELKANPTALLRKVEQCKWKEWIKSKSAELEVEKGLVAAAVLLSYEGKPDELGKLIFKQYWQNECSYKQIGITPYEGLGDLQGSSLLCNEAAIRKTVNILTDRCISENVKYLEVRCSPINYENNSSGLSADKVLQTICEELDKAKGLTSSVIIIASRHGDESKIKQSIELVQRLKENKLFKKYFRGFDLAGNESAKAARDVRDSFLEIMKDCYNITIHAGETMDSESIWEAVYYLSAERIGHGLKLLEKQELMDKLLERGIGIEMCPSSNYQIIGYRDNYHPTETATLSIYPIKDYLEKELKVCINTDDPGISLTNCTNELHMAARLATGGLSKWDVLQLICNGFRTAFFPYEKKKELIRGAEKELGELMKNKLL